MMSFTGNVDRESRSPGGNRPRIVILSASVGSGHVRAARRSNRRSARSCRMRPSPMWTHWI